MFTTPWTQENGARTRCAAVVNHSAIVNSLLVVNLLCVVFLVRRGYISNLRRSFDVYVFVLKSNSLTNNNFTYVYIVSVKREIPEKGLRYVHQIQIHGVQNLSHMCMCIEFLIQVLNLGRDKGDAPKVTEPNLRFPAVFCENLQFSAKICGFMRFPAPFKCLNFQEKG